MHPLAAGGEELADRGVLGERLEQLDVRRPGGPGTGAAGRHAVGDVQHRLPHALRLVRLAAGHGQPERRGVELDGRVEVPDGDAYVVDARQDGNSHAGDSAALVSLTYRHTTG